MEIPSCPSVGNNSRNCTTTFVNLASSEGTSMSELSQPSFESSPESSKPTSEDRLGKLVQARYPDNPDLQNHVLESASKAGTVDRIVSGELSLPHPEDARRDLERVQRQEQERQR